MSASVGFIALFGAAVLNGLLLLTTVQRVRQAGAAPEDAATRGGRERLRPPQGSSPDAAGVLFVPAGDGMIDHAAPQRARVDGSTVSIHLPLPRSSSRPPRRLVGALVRRGGWGTAGATPALWIDVPVQLAMPLRFE